MEEDDDAVSPTAESRGLLSSKRGGTAWLGSTKRRSRLQPLLLLVAAALVGAISAVLSLQLSGLLQKPAPLLLSPSLRSPACAASSAAAVSAPAVSRPSPPFPSSSYFPSCFFSPSTLDAAHWLRCDEADALSGGGVTSEQLHRYCTDYGATPSAKQRSLGPLQMSRPPHGNADVVFSLSGNWTEFGCSLRVLGPAAARRLLSNRRLLFIGDSTTQELVTELVAFLEGSPLHVDFVLTAWINQRQCSGNHQGYAARTLHTARFPSPALSLFNITVMQLWNGHVSECDNSGGVEQQLHPEFINKLITASHLCSNRTAHLQLLSKLWALPQPLELLQTGHDSADDRERVFQLLHASTDPLTGDKPELLNASLDVWRRADLHSILPLVRSCLSAAVSFVAHPSAAFSLQAVNASAPAASIDLALYNAGQHLTHPGWGRVPPASFLPPFTRTLFELFSLLHRAAHAVAWKDSSPNDGGPGALPITAMNAAGRSVAALTGRRAGQSAALDVWPVEAALSGLNKSDARHCSFKDNVEADILRRDRQSRTVFCHTAVQLLLQHIQAADDEISCQA